MSPNPIGRVLSIFRKHRVRALLMGGQACILYGAAEFSRDIDVDVLAEPKNLLHLQRALDELQAEPVFVPPWIEMRCSSATPAASDCMIPPSRDCGLA